MATTIKMPQLGESVTEGTIERWLVKVGDAVAQYDPLFEVVTDKVNAEVPAEVGGVVTSILVEDGQTVKVGTPLAEIAEDGEAAATTASPASTTAAAPRPPAAAKVELEAPPETEEPPASVAPETVAAAPSATVAPAAAVPVEAAVPPAPSAAEETPAQPEPAPAPPAVETPPAPADPAAKASETPSESGEAGMRMTPAVRRLVREHNLDVAQIPGTGAGGRVTRDDVLAYVAAGQAASAAASAPEAVATEPAPQAPSAPPAAPPSPATRARPARSRGGPGSSHRPRSCGGSGRRGPARSRGALGADPRSCGGSGSGVHATGTPARTVSRAHARCDSRPDQRRRGVADDPDAEGHRGQDDPGQADRPPRLHGGRGRHDQRRSVARGEQRGLQGPRGSRDQLRGGRHQGRDRGAPCPPHHEQPVRGGPDHPQAPAEHRYCGGRGQRAGRASHPRRRSAVHQRRQPPRPGSRRAHPRESAEARRDPGRHVHRQQHRLVRIDLIDADHQRAGGGHPVDGGHRQAADA